MDFMEWVKGFLAPAIGRLIVKMIAGGLITLGVSSESVQKLISDNAFESVIIGALVAVVGLLLSKKNDVKNINTPPPVQ